MIISKLLLSFVSIKMVETPKSSADNSLEMWNKFNKNSKLNDVVDIIKNSAVNNVKQLMEYIVHQDYTWLQKAVWHMGTIDGKLWSESLKSVKKYAENAELEALREEEKKETEDELQDKKQEVEELKSIVIANEGKDKFSLKEQDWKIKIDKRTISFEWLVLQDENWNEKRIAKIDNFYVKKTNNWLEIYSNGEQLPRFKLNNDWTVEWRLNPNDNKFDIKLDWNWTIFESLKVELTNNYDKYKTPERKVDFTWAGFSIDQWSKKFSVRGGHMYFSWLKLYNSESKKWETIQNITNMYVKRDSDNNLTIYSSGEENPKMVLKPNGIVQWVLPSSWETLNYGAKEDMAMRRVIWGELNSRYNTYRHEDVASTSEPVLITYTTKEEPRYVDAPSGFHKEVDENWNTIRVSEPIVADGRWNGGIKFDRNSRGEYVSGPIVADGRWNTRVQTAKEEDYSDMGFHKEIDKNWNTVRVSGPIVADGRWR